METGEKQIIKLMRKYFIVIFTLLLVSCTEDTYEKDCNLYNVTKSDINFFTVEDCNGEEPFNFLLKSEWGDYNQGEIFNPYAETRDIPTVPIRSLNITINLWLPMYNHLQFGGNYIVINSVIIVNNGFCYRCFDLLDPFSSIIMSVNNDSITGNNGYNYLIRTGATYNKQNKLREYKVKEEGSSLIIKT
jgi:hypothetical protein